MEYQAQTFSLRPDIPFDAEYPLTIVDGLMPPSNGAYLFIYDTTDEKQDAAIYQKDLADRLQKSLRSFIQNPGEKLKGYPELLGSICEDPLTARVHVKVMKSSEVKFTVAIRNDISYQDLRPDLQFPTNCVPLEIFAPGLATIVPTDTKERPAFWVRLTFVKGGFVLMANKHHFLVDGTGLAKFMQEWFLKARELKSSGEKDVLSCKIDRNKHNQRLLDFEKYPTTHLAPGLNYKVAPGARRTMYGCPDFDSNIILFVKRVVEFITYWFPSLPLGTKTQMFHFKMESLQQLKDIAESKAPTRISTNDSMMAFIWRCVTRARQTGIENPQGSSKMLFIADFRSRLDPPLLANYFGNAVQCLPSSMPIATLLEPTKDFLGVTAAALRASLQKLDTSLVRSSVQFVASHQRTSDVQEDLKIFRGPDIFTTSWENFYPSTESLELGVGKFRRVRCPGRPSYDGGYIVMPAYGLRDVTPEDDKSYPGGLEVLLDLRKPHMDALMTDSEWRQFVTWPGKIES
ncbi:hypothetical protein G7Y89_g346 [Cudoniella acicularis]|uniref:Trichothecene 3-O-acetyltransferase-like N-terminal domain-containing protein n=1 Tax=Cudoniella acicularis TaxID=354080 RepID=A0A8H4RY62_9HELO|nr:hypothetical protein G7Y89_g346 [Cudoniella acicularis]